MVAPGSYMYLRCKFLPPSILLLLTHRRGRRDRSKPCQIFGTVPRWTERYLVHEAPCTIRTLWMRVTGGAVWDRFANSELARMKLIVWWECSQIYFANNGHSLSSQKKKKNFSLSISVAHLSNHAPSFFPACPHLLTISPFRQRFYLTSLSFSIFLYAISRLLSLLYTHRGACFTGFKQRLQL